LTVNLLLLSGVVSLVESVAVGRSGGLTDDQLRELLGGAASPSVKSRFEAVLGAPWDGWWTTALGAKDAGLAMDVAKGAGIDLAVAGSVRDAYLRAAADGYGDADIAAVRHLYLT
jgi:3-hydroxyisobutyrate dehydrogenase